MESRNPRFPTLTLAGVPEGYHVEVKFDGKSESVTVLTGTNHSILGRLAAFADAFGRYLRYDEAVQARAWDTCEAITDAGEFVSWDDLLTAYGHVMERKADEVPHA